MSEPQLQLSPEEQQLVNEYRRQQELAAVAPHARERVMMCVGGFSFAPQGDDLSNVAFPLPDANPDGGPAMDVPLMVIQDAAEYARVFAGQVVERPRSMRIRAAAYIGTIDEIVALVRAQLEAAAQQMCTMDKFFPMRDAAAAKQIFAQLTGYTPGGEALPSIILVVLRDVGVRELQLNLPNGAPVMPLLRRLSEEAVLFDDVMAAGEVDGLLVGGASLDAEGWSSIVRT